MVNFENLNSAQKEAVLYTDGPLIVFAGAGTGKTRVITYRIANLLQQGVSPYSILAVTFTNKAANEMKKRVSELAGEFGGNDVKISTFHSFCMHLLINEARNFGFDSNFLIYDMNEQVNVIKECMKELNLDDKKFKPVWIANKISRAKDNLDEPGDMQAQCQKNGDFYGQTVSTIYELYQKKLKTYNAFDFGDLIMQTVFNLQNNPAILEKYQERLKYVLVDEYQDTNHAQYMLTKILTDKYKNICVVGDDDQSIYSWRGADINNILDFEKDYPHCKTIKLEENYRSTPQILKRAWNVVKNNYDRVEKQLWTNNEDRGNINVFQNMNENDEAHRVADMILINKQNGYKLSDFAIFYRTNAQSRALEDALRREGLPYSIVGTLKFYDRAEIKDIMAYLKLIHNPNDNISFKRVVNVPKRGIGKTSMERLENFANEQNISLFEALKFIDKSIVSSSSIAGFNSFKQIIEKNFKEKFNKTIKEIVEEVINDTKYIEELEFTESPENKSKIENIQELVSAIEDFEQRSPDKSLAGYLSQIALISDIDSWQDSEDKVTMMTLHLAKGLEFKNVFITGLEEGLFPIGEAAYNHEELEEERRLMYVGMTRAKENLYMTWASQRTVFGKTKFNVPSRFLLEAGFKEQISDFSANRIVKDYNFNTTHFYKNSTEYENSNEISYEKINDEGPYSIGTLVSHAVFGNGKIIDKSGVGDNLKLVVLFSNGQWKKLLAKFANLTILK